MTVAELIEALKAYPPDTPVLVDGYEGGYCRPTVVTEDIYPTPGAAWYCGDFDRAEDCKRRIGFDASRIERAVILSREGA